MGVYSSGVYIRAYSEGVEGLRVWEDLGLKGFLEFKEGLGRAAFSKALSVF